MRCKGICDNLQNGYSGYPKYNSGYKYCPSCRFSLMCNDIQCPCCNQILRLKAKTKSFQKNS